MLRAGSRWEGHLVLSSSGSEGAPILVDQYGEGALPRIDGDGKVENVIELINVEEIEVRHIEITNRGEQYKRAQGDRGYSFPDSGRQGTEPVR